MPVTLPSCECVEGLIPFDKLTQIYAAAYVLAGEDASLPTVECVAGMPPFDRLTQIYAALYIAADDDSLLSPLCVAARTPFDRLTSIYAAAYSIAEDDTLPTVECVAALPPFDRLSAIYCALYDAEVTPVAPTPDILWWQFLEGGGTDIGATVGQNGTTDASWVTGKSGSGFALDFNGTDDNASTTGAVTYGTNTITVCGWFWFDSTAGTQMLLESSDSYVNANCFGIFVDAGVLFISNSGATGQRQENLAFTTTGAWVHLAFVLSPTDNKVYLDAVDQATSVSINTRTGTADYDAQTLFVGARNNSSLFFNGRIDDLRIYAGDVSADLALIMAEAA